MGYVLFPIYDMRARRAVAPTPYWPSVLKRPMLPKSCSKRPSCLPWVARDARDRIDDDPILDRETRNLPHDAPVVEGDGDDAPVDDLGGEEGMFLATLGDVEPGVLAEQRRRRRRAEDLRDLDPAMHVKLDPGQSLRVRDVTVIGDTRFAGRQREGRSDRKQDSSARWRLIFEVASEDHVGDR